MQPIITQVPTNIITGFLGTGKTSTIQHLLTFKPAHERWAVLVNEFGSVGVDATLYQNTNSEEGGVFVREVPGGCMCCTSALPMQIALNVLLKLSNPHRLLIEPSGLGHPAEVLSLLKSKYYQNVLDIQKTITVLDPSQFLEDKYFEHPTYQQQLDIADVWVFNKADTLKPKQRALVEDKQSQLDRTAVDCVHARFGRVDPDLMVGATQFKDKDAVEVGNNLPAPMTDLPESAPIPEDVGFLKSNRSDEGYHCISWRFNDRQVFSRARLVDWLKSIQAERIKGVFNTNVGTIGFNLLKGQMQIINFKTQEESKLEIIAQEISPNWDQELAGCLIGREPQSPEAPIMAQSSN